MKKVSFFTVLLLILLAIVISTALADGTETLGPPSITIASGSGFVAAGTGLETQTGQIDVNVPGTVQQVLLYWSGEFREDGSATDTITVNGTNVDGGQIGGPTPFYGNVFVAGYRADITSLGKVSAGPNSLTIGGLDFDVVNHGAGVLVIYDDGSGASDIQIRDGVDLAFINFPDPRMTTVPQIFTFAPATTDRIADLLSFVGSVGGANRPNAYSITVNGTTTTLVNPFGSFDGGQWDTIIVPVTIPAGATSVTVQVLSQSDGSGNLPASLTWVAAGLSVSPPDGEGCTPGYWKNHFEDWPPTLRNPSDDFDTIFGVDLFDPDITLEEAVNAKGGGVKKLARHGTAALLNALHSAVDYPLSAAEVIAAVQAGDVDALVEYNELLAPGFCE